MYERFTDQAREVIRLANQEAIRFGHEYIGTEHVLLGLVKGREGVAANVLKNLGVDLKKVRLEVEKTVQSGPDMGTMGRLPQTPRAKKVIEYAIEEARNLNHNYIGTEHLLLGLLREYEGVAAQVLMNLGLRLGDVREEVLNLLGHNIAPDAAASSARTHDNAKADFRDLLEQALEAIRNVDDQIDQLNQQKEDAVAQRDFEKAAYLRDEADKLKKQREALIREWREKLK